MMRFFLIVLILLVCWTSTLTARILPGDADGDGGVDIMDVRYIENYLRTMKPHNLEFMSHLDVDADCDIDCDDADYLRDYLFESGPSPLESNCRFPEVDTCCWQRPGDATLDNFMDVSDAVYILNYVLYPDRVVPLSMAKMDADGNCVVSYEDVLYIMNYNMSNGPHPVACTCLEPATSLYADCRGICGDVNCDESIDLSDAVFLLSYLYNDGPPPCPVPACGNVSGSSSREVDLQDVMFIVNFSVCGGVSPGECFFDAWYPEPACCPYKSSE